MLSVICSANRDGHRFPDPDRFDIERQDTRHLSFSSGIHTCPGAALSRLEGRIAIQTLLRTFSELRLESDAPLEWVPSMMVRGFKSLPVAVTPA
ncbi:cytochrome P450 [Nannocystis pusilla]|uniref:cytochrome P450 n=1 Tax=Nannocystis pusilla TaxID=889268 RepID=UPI003B7CAECE